MKLHTMNLAETRTERNRVGRGPGSGNGKTSGRGQKGQKSRSGGGVRLGFEGGQTPLARRLPKRGFKNALFKTRYAVINLSDLDKFFNDGDVVTAEVLKERKIIKKLKTQKTRSFKGNQKTHIKQTNTKDNEILKTKF